MCEVESPLGPKDSKEDRLITRGGVGGEGEEKGNEGKSREGKGMKEVETESGRDVYYIEVENLDEIIRSGVAIVNPLHTKLIKNLINPWWKWMQPLFLLM